MFAVVGRGSGKQEVRRRSVVGGRTQRGGEGGLTDESSWYCKLQLVLLGKQGDNLREDGLALDLPIRCLGDNARSHLNLLSHLLRYGRREGLVEGKRREVEGGYGNKGRL